MPGSTGRQCAVAAIAVLAIVATACVGPTASGPTPSGTTATTAPLATRTLNPNEAARASVGATPSASPPTPRSTVSDPTPIPTPRVPTAMEVLLPSLGGGGTIPIQTADVLDTSSAQAATLRSMLERLGHPIEDFEGAYIGSCCSGITVADFRVRGVEPANLVEAYTRSLQESTPGATVTMRSVAGTSVRRIRWADGTTQPDLHLAVLNDVVYVFSASADRQPSVDAAIGFMSRPRLDLLLPATIAGKPVQRVTFPASAIPTGGDTCSFVCPGESQGLASELGVPVEQIDVAIASSHDLPGAFIVAFRVPGASAAGLMRARIAVSAGGAAPLGEEAQAIGGKSVTLVVVDPFPDSSRNEYLYAKDHVLYSIRPANSDGPPTDAVVEAIRALP